MVSRNGMWTAIALITSVVGAQDDGVTSTTIVLGQSCALKGPAKELGIGMRTGLQTCFDAVNAQGGVRGRQIRLRSINDGFDPERSKRGTQKLIEKNRVFAMIGGLGEAPSLASHALAAIHGVPYLAPMSGAGALRDPAKKWLVNVRASAEQELERLLVHLVDDLELTRIACLMQGDALGEGERTLLTAVLDKRRMKLVAVGTYKRNTMAVKPALDAIVAGRPQAVILLGTYGPCAEFVRQAAEHPQTSKVAFAALSTVGLDALAVELKDVDASCIVTQVVPFPWDQNVPLVREFSRRMETAGRKEEIGFASLEGYIAGRLFCDVLAKVEGAATREAFMRAITKTARFDLGGFELTFGATDIQGSDNVYLTQLRRGRIEKVVPVSAAPGK